MAYDFFPKSSSEVEQKLTKTGWSEAKVKDAVALFQYLARKNPTPINIDLKAPGKLNVTRALQVDMSIKDIMKSADISSFTLKFGNGSSGNRGANNKGNAYEGVFNTALNDWWAGRPEWQKNSKDAAAIEELVKEYDFAKAKTFRTDIMGGENTRRPLQFGSKIVLANPKGKGYDVGKSVTDITVTTDKEEVFLSLKLGNTTTFFNVGVKTILTKKEILEGDIKNANGKKLLALFGIDPQRFCGIFNGDKASSGKVKVSKYDKSGLQELLMSGIGYNYHVIHKLAGKTISKKMDKDAMKKAAAISGSIELEYGGKTGSGKRVNIVFKTKTYIFQLNIRDTQGTDGYPTRLMCDFKYR